MKNFMDNMSLEGKTVLVTGGTGSIGSEIVRQVLAQRPSVLRIYSRDEAKQHDMRMALESHPNVRFLLGDVRELERLKRALEDVDVVFHAAALKHVPACEYDPFEAVKTNVLGTQNLITAALECEVQKVVAISTDKAVNPINTMGATKLLAEKLVTWAAFYRKREKQKTTFCTVRFGNVVDSRGSVLPLFQKQIQRGGPVTLTNGEMTRYIISIPQAVKLVFEACAMAKGGEVFVLKMPIIRLRDLAEVLVQRLAPHYGFSPAAIPIQDIGSRVGEKLHEDLISAEEWTRTEDRDPLFVVHPWQEKYLNKSASSTRPEDAMPRYDRPALEKFLDKSYFPSVFGKETPEWIERAA